MPCTAKEMINAQVSGPSARPTVGETACVKVICGEYKGFAGEIVHDVRLLNEGDDKPGQRAGQKL